MNDLDGVDLLLFNIDGTLVQPKSGETMRKTADDWQWIPRRKEALQLLMANGKKIALVTNQGGVSFGYLHNREIRAELRKMIDEIDPENAFRFGSHKIDYQICCTDPKATLADWKKENDFRRKPNPGMLLQSMVDFEVSPSNTLMVGDMEDDQAAAKNARCDFMWADEFFALLTGVPPEDWKTRGKTPRQ